MDTCSENKVWSRFKFSFQLIKIAILILPRALLVEIDLRERIYNHIDKKRDKSDFSFFVSISFMDSESNKNCNMNDRLVNKDWYNVFQK